MLTKHIRSLKQLAVFVLIITMLAPSVVLSAEPQHDAPYFNHSNPAPMGYYAPALLAESNGAANYYSSGTAGTLNGLSPAGIEELLNEQANLWRQDPNVQASIRFYDLINSSYPYSNLPESDRLLLLNKLDIAEGAFAVAHELFFFMERDGLSLAQSVDIMVIISEGVFTYDEAKTLISRIPNMIERNRELMRFVQLMQNFDIPQEVAPRRLTNRPFAGASEAAHTVTFANINSFLDSVSFNAQYSFIQTAQAMEFDDVVSIIPAYDISFEDTFNYTNKILTFEEEQPPAQYYTAPPYLARYTRTEPSNATRTRPWLDRSQTESTATAVAFTNEYAFNVAKELFLASHSVAEIEAAFALGAALQMEPQTFILAADISQSATMDYPFNIQLVMYAADTGMEEVEYILEYGMDILGFGVSPASTPISHVDIISQPFNLHFDINDSVCLNTGSLTYRKNILSLPGRGGFGLSLGLVYNSSHADLLCVTTGGSSVDMRHSLGAGWSFDLPHIDNNDVLHIPGKGSFLTSDTEFVDYTLQDMQLFADISFTSGSTESDLRLTFFDGTSYFFSTGLIIGKRDRFGNTISFEYEYVSGTISGYDVTWGPLLFRVTDSNGKQINFNNQMHNNGNRTIAITGPDSSTFVINMVPINDISINAEALRLTSVVNQVGKTTYFDYNLTAFLYDPDSRTPRHSNYTLLLKQVGTVSGATLNFDFGMRVVSTSATGSRQAHIVTERWLTNCTLQPGAYSGRMHRTTFSYRINSGTVINFPRFSAAPNQLQDNGTTSIQANSDPVRDPILLPPPVTTPPTYSTTVTQNNGLTTIYTFNFQHLNIMQHTTGGGLTIEQSIAYSTDRLPTAITRTERTSERSRTTTQRFEYNQYGQVTTAVSPLADGSTHERYRTVTTYDSRYGLPLTTIFWMDATTTVKEVNRLCANGRNVIGTDIYENGTRKSRVNFVHDIYGNIAEIQEFPYINSNEFITTQIIFNSGTLPAYIRTTGVLDANNNPVNGTDIVEHSFIYDSMWRILSQTDPNGYVTSWQYDELGRVTRITHPNSGYESYTYNDTLNTLIYRTVLGATYTHQFDSAGNLLTIACPNGIVIQQNTYDNRMRLIETRTAQGVSPAQVTTFAYDIFDRTTQIRTLGGATENIVYDEIVNSAGNSRIITTTVSNDVSRAPHIQTTVTYNRFGHRIQEGTIGGRVFTYTHDLSGRVIREQSLGIDNTFTHNIFGITSVTNNERNTSHNTYDSMGRLLSTTDFMGNTQHFTYDNLDRLIRHEAPFTEDAQSNHYSTTLYFYDRNSNVLQTHTSINLPGAAAEWSVTTNTFQYNRLASTQTGNGPLTEFTYDLAGNILTQRVGGSDGATTSFVYNNRGQLLQTTDALGQAETFTYDNNGLLLTHTNRNDTVFTNTYDRAGRLTRVDAVQDGVNVGSRTYIFFDTGAIRNRSNGTHSITYEYDAQGRIRRQTETGGIVRTFAYNPANNITEEHVYVNNVMHYRNTYSFNTAQRVTRVTSNGVLQATYTYNANGNRVSTVLANGVTTEYTRNAAGLITTVVNRRGTNILSRFDYVYYLDGNTSKVVEQLGTTTRTIVYTYDAARRLTQENVAGDGALTREFAFDSRGNRVSMVVAGAENYTVTYMYDINNRLLAETRTGYSPFTATLTYDRNGNQLTRTSDGQTETRMYDAFNRLVQFSSGSTADGSTTNIVTSSYTYRADGLRHSKTVNGVRTYHVWNRGNIVLERNVNGVVSRRYYRSITGRLIRCHNNGWYLYNNRGDVVQRTNDQGVVLHNYRYSAFGVEVSPNPSNANRFRFSGEYWDGHRGEIYLRARSYNPRTGRFTQPDPFWNIGNMQVSRNAIAQAGNLYMFAMHNPVMWLDPSGLFVIPSQGLNLMWIQPRPSQSLIGQNSTLRNISPFTMAGGNPNCDFQSLIADGGPGMGGLKRIPKPTKPATATKPPAAPKPAPRSPSSNAAGNAAGSAVRGTVNTATQSSHTQGNFRTNLQHLTGQTGVGKQAHHVLPQKFVDQFRQAGINNIHNPRYGSWVETTAHQQWGNAYNWAWEKFFMNVSNPTIQQIYQHARELSQIFGFNIGF